MAEFSLQTKMGEIETRFPFSRQLLYKNFHLGGCASCGFEPEESIEDVAKKHSKDPVDILNKLNDGFDDMRDCYIESKILPTLSSDTTMLLDVREPWEFEVAQIPGSVLMSEENMEQVFEQAKTKDVVVVICHHGLRAMNATLYMKDCGVNGARCLRGGIDAYSTQVDSTIPQY